MTDTRAAPARIGGIGLLERAVNYTLGSLHIVTPAALSRPTPCAGWDLRTLLAHLNDSFLALYEAKDAGAVRLDAATDSDIRCPDPVATVRNHACQLLGAWANADRETVTVGGLPLTAGIVTSVGALEIAVHGWDLAQACGSSRPIPPSLAEEILDLSRLLIGDLDRPGRFAVPVAVGPRAGPSDRLLGFLGRDPDSI